MQGKDAFAEFYGKELAGATLVTVGECFAKYK